MAGYGVAQTPSGADRPRGRGSRNSAVPVRIEIFIIFTRVFGSSPSLCMPHGIPSESRALVSAKYAGLEIAKIIRYSQALAALHIASYARLVGRLYGLLLIFSSKSDSQADPLEA